MHIRGGFPFKTIATSYNGPRAFAICLTVAVFGLAASPADAAKGQRHAANSARSDAVAAVAKKTEKTVAIQSDADPAENCTSARRRLFVEDEGWIVRRVTTCY